MEQFLFKQFLQSQWPTSDQPRRWVQSVNVTAGIFVVIWFMYRAAAYAPPTPR